MIYIHGEIYTELAREVLPDIMRDLADQGDLVVCSSGGDLDEAFALHDAMRQRTYQMPTLALGRCMSAAVLLVAAGAQGERKAGRNTTFMLHNVELEGAGDPKTLIRLAEVSERMMAKYARLLAQYSKRNRDHWQAMFDSGSDVFFTAGDAFDWGLIDKIV